MTLSFALPAPLQPVCTCDRDAPGAMSPHVLVAVAVAVVRHPGTCRPRVTSTSTSASTSNRRSRSVRPRRDLRDVSSPCYGRQSSRGGRDGGAGGDTDGDDPITAVEALAEFAEGVHVDRETAASLHARALQMLRQNAEGVSTPTRQRRAQRPQHEGMTLVDEAASEFGTLQVFRVADDHRDASFAGATVLMRAHTPDAVLSEYRAGDAPCTDALASVFGREHSRRSGPPRRSTASASDNSCA